MRHVTRSRATVVLLALSAVGFILLAPASLGGSTTWVTTNGVSMQPGIHAGDLVITRPDSDYRTGDVVAYHSEALHGTIVLHRVVDTTPSGLVTRGDNNGWLDPDRPQPDEVLGKLWLHIPGGGHVVSLFADPWLLLAIGLGLVVIVVAGTDRTVQRARRRARGAPTGAGRRKRTSLPSPADAGVARSRAEWAAVLALVFTGVAVFAFTQPVSTPADAEVKLLNTADLSYSAPVAAREVYRSDQVHTGDPLFLNLAPEVDTLLHYRLLSRADGVTGTVRTTARISASNGWEHTIVPTQPTRFAGLDVEQRASVDFAALLQAAHVAEQAAGTTFGGYTVEVEYDIAVEATVDGARAATTYQPRLSFSLDATQAVLLDDTTLEAGGERVVRASAEDQMSVPGVEPNSLHVVGRELPVRWLRPAAVVLALLAAAAAALAAGRVRSHRTAALESWGGRLVTVSNIDIGTRPVIDIHHADSLSRLAAHYDVPVLHVPRQDGDLYHVIVDDTLYRYLRLGRSRRIEPQPADAVHADR
jgi:signal peptidase I